VLSIPFDFPADWRVNKEKKLSAEYESKVYATHFSENWLFGVGPCSDRFPWWGSDSLF
jgi:hypothetical protein